MIAAGGDGTLNEVLNGLAGGFDRIELGLLPLGTANDFARSVNVPADIGAAAEVLRRGQTRRIDVVRLTTCESPEPRYFINVSAGGFSTKVDEKLEKRTKLWWGALGYALSAVKALPDLEPYEVTMAFDDEAAATFPIYNVVVANARYVGGNIPVAPRARLDDGRFDVLVFRAVTLSRLMTLVPRALLGEHLEDDDVLFRQAQRLTISSEPTLELNTDGELIGSCPATFEIVPSAVSFIVGEEPTAAQA